MGKNSSSNGGGMGCLVIALLAVVAMPVVGIYLVGAGETRGQKLLGLALFIVSIIVYAKFGML